MKKLIASFIFAFGLVFGMFAQLMADVEDILNEGKFDSEKTKLEVIIPEEQHTTDRNADVRIEYFPLYDEVRIYYTTLYVTYDRGEAMNTVLACLQDFQTRFSADKDYHYEDDDTDKKIFSYYRSYNYLKPDRERFFKDDRGQRKAQYISHVKFVK